MLGGIRWFVTHPNSNLRQTNQSETVQFGFSQLNSVELGRRRSRSGRIENSSSTIRKMVRSDGMDSSKQASVIFEQPVVNRSLRRVVSNRMIHNFAFLSRRELLKFLREIYIVRLDVRCDRFQRRNFDGKTPIKASESLPNVI